MADTPGKALCLTRVDEGLGKGIIGWMTGVGGEADSYWRRMRDGGADWNLRRGIDQIVVKRNCSTPLSFEILLHWVMSIIIEKIMS